MVGSGGLLSFYVDAVVEVRPSVFVSNGTEC